MGEFGDIELGSDLSSFRSRGQVLRNLVLAVLLAIGGSAAIIWLTWPSVRYAAGWLLAAMAYVLIAFLVRPKPNVDNLGAADGMIDHPFRISDDVNRSLVGLAVLLAPGRFIADGLVDGYHYVVRGKLPHDRLLAKIERER